MRRSYLAISILIACPALAVDAPKAPAPVGLSQDVIDAAVKKDIAKIRKCYNDNTKDVSPKPSGIVTTRFMIGPDGKVASVDLVGSDLNSPKVESCLIEQLKSFVFPAPASGAVRVDYPFRFVPSAEKKTGA